MCSSVVFIYYIFDMKKFALSQLFGLLMFAWGAASMYGITYEEPKDYLILPNAEWDLCFATFIDEDFRSVYGRKDWDCAFVSDPKFIGDFTSSIQPEQWTWFNLSWSNLTGINTQTSWHSLSSGDQQ